MSLSPSETLYAQIRDHLICGNAIVVVGAYRSTLYKPKHLPMIRSSRDPHDTGIYVQKGHRWVYVFPGSIRFGTLRTAA